MSETLNHSLNRLVINFQTSDFLWVSHLNHLTKSFRNICMSVILNHSLNQFVLLNHLTDWFRTICMSETLSHSLYWLVNPINSKPSDCVYEWLIYSTDLFKSTSLFRNKMDESLNHVLNRFVTYTPTYFAFSENQTPTTSCYVCARVKNKPTSVLRVFNFVPTASWKHEMRSNTHPDPNLSFWGQSFRLISHPTSLCW